MQFNFDIANITFKYIFNREYISGRFMQVAGLISLQYQSPGPTPSQQNQTMSRSSERERAKRAFS